MKTPRKLPVKPTITEETLAANLIATYPKINGGSPSSWTLFNNDFTKVDHTVGVCHALMAHQKSVYYSWGIEPNIFDQLITAVPNKSDAALLYLSWLRLGPFSQWADFIKLKKLGDDYYLLITGLDVIPANVLYNLCIATRVPIEWVGPLANWYTLIGAGCPPSLAFMCAMRVDMCIRMQESTVADTQPGKSPLNWTLDHTFGISGHFWLDTTSNWYHVMRGTPLTKHFTKPYKSNPGACRPCNLIWGSGDRELWTKMKFMTVRDVMKLFEDEANRPPDPFVSQPDPDHEVLLDEDFDDDDDLFQDFDDDEDWDINDD